MTLFHIFLTLDEPSNLSRETYWRDALMKLFYQDITEKGMNIISDLNQFGNICEIGWKGTTCDGEELIKIEYDAFWYGNFCIGALPNSTAIVYISDCKQTFIIQTRSFPKNLQTISLSGNKITGQIDLKTLPTGLLRGYFYDNKMTGPIVLTNLPRGLQELFLGSNKIRQNTVWYDDIPRSVTTIGLRSFGDKQTIKEVRAVHPENAVVNKRIFKGVQTSNVH